jgi:hypothetical protein
MGRAIARAGARRDRFIDPALRVNVADVLRQIAWYKSQGMPKADVDGNQIIDSATSFRCLNYCAC